MASNAGVKRPLETDPDLDLHPSEQELHSDKNSNITMNETFDSITNAQQQSNDQQASSSQIIEDEQIKIDNNKDSNGNNSSSSNNSNDQSSHKSIKRHCRANCSNSSKNHHHLAHDSDNIENNLKPLLPDPSLLPQVLKQITRSVRPIREEVTDYLKNELKKDTSLNADEIDKSKPIFSFDQTQEIVENMIEEREEKVRIEYEQMLNHHLSEQYKMFLKTGYLNSLGARFPPPPNASVVETIQACTALETAFTTMQRTTAAAAAAAASSNVTIQDLTSFPSLGNGNPLSASLTPSQLASLNFQHQASALHAAQHQHVQATHQQNNQQSRLSVATSAKAAPAATTAHQQHLAISPNASSTSPVLLVSNIDEQLATPEALFTLFGVFGDVIRVKILFNKKDNALVQMADANQAHVALSFLDKQIVFKKLLRVARSKHQIVQMPRDASDVSLTKDFTNSPLHRFKIPGSRNYLNIYPPSNTLHISNIPSTISEADICKAFERACKFDCRTFKFFPKDRKMALMKFDTVEQATIALIKLHNYQISDDHHLRVSFSKSLI